MRGHVDDTERCEETIKEVGYGGKVTGTRACRNPGHHNCSECSGWFCLTHLSIIMGTRAIPARFVCAECYHQMRDK